MFLGLLALDVSNGFFIGVVELSFVEFEVAFEVELSFLKVVVLEMVLVELAFEDLLVVGAVVLMVLVWFLEVGLICFLGFGGCSSPSISDANIFLLL